MPRLRAAVLYTLLKFGVGVAAGMVTGIVWRILGVEHQWGAFDAVLALRVILTIAVDAVIFAVLATKRPSEYYRVGILVVIFSLILETVTNYFISPSVAREASNWMWLVLGPLILNVAVFAIVGFALRMRRSSSNSSLERARDS
jgi:hypothetical protein